jgi:hypothetical protein
MPLAKKSSFQAGAQFVVGAVDLSAQLASGAEKRYSQAAGT